MPRELKDLEVSWISLVDKGANNKTILWKGSESDQHLKTIDIAKVNDEQQIVLGIVYSPNQVDAHGDFADAETIKQAAYNFMKARNTANVDKQHNLEKQDAYIAESWIVEKGDPRFPEPGDVGAWAVAIKIEDADLWQAVKSGEITGISLYGKSHVEEDVEPEKKSLWKQFSEWVGKTFSDNLQQDDLMQAVYRMSWALEKTLREIIESETGDKQAEINQAIEDFKAAINGLSITKAGAVLSASNLKALNDALQKIMSVLETANKNNKEAEVEQKDLDQIKQAVADGIEQGVKKALETKTDGDPPPENPEPTIKELSDKIAQLEKQLTDTQSQSPDGSQPVAKSYGIL